MAMTRYICGTTPSGFVACYQCAEAGLLQAQSPSWPPVRVVLVLHNLSVKHIWYVSPTRPPCNKPCTHLHQLRFHGRQVHAYHCFCVLPVVVVGWCDGQLQICDTMLQSSTQRAQHKKECKVRQRGEGGSCGCWHLHTHHHAAAAFSTHVHASRSVARQLQNPVCLAIALTSPVPTCCEVQRRCVVLWWVVEQSTIPHTVQLALSRQRHPGHVNTLQQHI
jgi:hypothetical protein